MTFENVYQTHHVELAACQNVVFDSCVFKDFYCKKDAANSANNEALQFDVLHNSEHFTKYPNFDDTPCKNVTVNNCTFKNLQRGVGSHSAVAGSYFDNMKFTNNTFQDIKGYAIITTNYRSSEISGNTIERCGAGIMFRSMVQGYNNFYTPLKKKFTIDNDADSVIANNKISVKDQKYKTTAYGISLYGDKLSSKENDVPKGDYTLENVKVQNNTIVMNNSGYGIWLQGTKGMTVSGNKVTMNIKSSVSGKGNADCIRLVESKKSTIKNNTLTQKKKNKKTSEACGIVLTTKSDATITGNKITSSPKDGIYVFSNSKATVSKNTIKKTGRHGINVCANSAVTMKGNKISGYKGKITNTYSGGKIKNK
jgi:parallel beta-helix repeat protein